MSEWTLVGIILGLLAIGANVWTRIALRNRRRRHEKWLEMSDEQREAWVVRQFRT